MKLLSLIVAVATLSQASPYFVVYTQKEVDYSRRFLMWCGDGTDNCNTVYYDKEYTHKADTLGDALAWMDGKGCIPAGPNELRLTMCLPKDGFKVVALYAGNQVHVAFEAVGTKEELVTKKVLETVPDMKWVISHANKTHTKSQ